MRGALADGPFLRATFTIHDQPSILLDHDRQIELLTAARMNTGTSEWNKGEVRADEEAVVSTQPNEVDRFQQDWYRACAADSPLNTGEKELRERYQLELLHSSLHEQLSRTPSSPPTLQRWTSAGTHRYVAHFERG